MSSSTQAHKSRSAAAHANDAALAGGTETATGGNGQDTTALSSATVLPHGTAPMSIDAKDDDKNVLYTVSMDVPVKFVAGMVHTDHTARIVQAAVERQFINNFEANAKARAKRHAAATTDAERAENAPYTAEFLLAKWAGYLPNVGDTVRVGTLERMKLDAARQVWNSRIAAHDRAVIANEPPVIKAFVYPEGNEKAGLAAPSAPFLRQRNLLNSTAKMSDNDKAIVEAAWDTHLRTILATPSYAERVQTVLDGLIAAKASKKDKAPAAESVTVALAPEASLLD